MVKSSLLGFLLMSTTLMSTSIYGQDKSGFVAMFNGKDLSGWNTTGNWVVERDNTITLKPRPGERGWTRYKDYLTTDRQYGDFVLDLEFNYLILVSIFFLENHPNY